MPCVLSLIQLFVFQTLRSKLKTASEIRIQVSDSFSFLTAITRHENRDMSLEYQGYESAYFHCPLH